MPKLTKRAVDALKPKAQGDLVVWDTEITRFGVRVKPSGKKSYIIQYRAKGRSKRFTIGPHGVMTADEARKEARSLLATVDRGGDPAAERKRGLKAPTIKELAERYLEEHAKPKKKPSGYYKDKQLLKSLILPEFGGRKVEDLERAEVATFHNRVGAKTPIQANRTLAVLSKMMTLSEKWGLRPDGSNPCRHVERFKENKRERYLSADELATLGKALSREEVDGRTSPYAIAALRFMLLSGVRVGEALSLRWEWIDVERSCIFMPDSKTGQKVIPLGAAALDLLESVPRLAGNSYVFAGKMPGKPIHNLRGPWEHIRDIAGLEGVRMHDLRHSWASQAAAAGLSLPIIGAVLGHSEPVTTQRYAHLSNDPLKAAADMVSERILQGMNNASDEEDNNKVVNLADRRAQRKNGSNKK